uniref:Uncharacterized protein MANES_09G151900 n=1 Tax=Rhizophora mucronata TaxID=61149 RepID=A0A2P2KMH0_RHIMU
MAETVVKVKRETLEACMTCPLCNKLLNDATTISLCLHTFCRRCIYEKLSDEEADFCPVCHIDLGCLPVEKLRPDHNLEDIRAKIFPYKRRKIKPPEVMMLVALPTKRKERSLSSLVVSAPKVPMQTGLTGRRSRAGARKAATLRGCSFASGEANKKEDSTDEHRMSSSSSDSSNKIAQNKKQNMQDFSVAEPSDEQRPNNAEDDSEMMEGKADLWTPLNCLVEAANRTKLSKSISQGLSLAKSESLHTPAFEPHSPERKHRIGSQNGRETESYIPRNKNKEHRQCMKDEDDKSRTDTLPASVKRRRLTAARKRAAMSQDLSLTAQALLDVAGARSNRKDCPIWFSLVASEDQKGHASLPQMSACYLRIKNGRMPVAFIQKYLVKKLDLSSETEVEILCRGLPVHPTLQLHDLLDLWFRTASTSKKIAASVGSSAKDSVMVLSYCRKVQAP